MAIFLLIVLIAIVLGIIGAVVKGLIWLLIIGIVVFLIDLLVAGSRMRGRRGRVHR